MIHVFLTFTKIAFPVGLSGWISLGVRSTISALAPLCFGVLFEHEDFA